MAGRRDPFLEDAAAETVIRRRFLNNSNWRFLRCSALSRSSFALAERKQNLLPSLGEATGFFGRTTDGGVDDVDGVSVFFDNLNLGWNLTR